MFFRTSTLAALTAIGLAACAGHALAQPYYPHHMPPPGLSFALGDRDFDSRWRHSDVRERGAFCHEARRECAVDGRHSRACDLKWRYCSPQGHDYGYYYNR